MVFAVNMKWFLSILSFVVVISSIACQSRTDNLQTCFSPTTVFGTHAPAGPFQSGQLLFEETFDSLDFEKWQHEQTLAGGGNWEFQWYTNNRSNSFVENSTLHIVPTLLADEFGEGFLSSGTVNIHGGAPADECTNPQFWGCERTGTAQNILNPTKSARLRTVNSFAFKYGTVEVRAKMPAGDWLWPAIWLMPRSNAYGSWPSSGEIDLVESRGNRHLYESNNVTHAGTNQMGSTLHFGPRWDLNGYPFTNFVRNSAVGFNENFHVYRLEWTPESITFLLDNTLIGHVNSTADGGFWQRGRFDERQPGRENPWSRASMMAPFDQEFYLIINLAVGGTGGFFPDNAINRNSPKPWHNSSPRAFTDFWEGRSGWLPTWNLGVNDDSHLQVDYVRIWAL